MLNKVILMGRLTANPELRQTSAGVYTCRITIAVERNFVPQGGERQSDFITVMAWRQTAEFISKYFAKGKLIVVEGELRSGSYDDKRYPDVKHFTTDVYADQVYFAGDKPIQTGNYSQDDYVNQTRPAPAPIQQRPAEPAPAMSIGGLSDFEEVISDGDLPF